MFSTHYLAFAWSPWHWPLHPLVQPFKALIGRPCFGHPVVALYQGAVPSPVVLWRRLLFNWQAMGWSLIIRSSCIYREKIDSQLGGMIVRGSLSVLHHRVIVGSLHSDFIPGYRHTMYKLTKMFTPTFLVPHMTLFKCISRYFSAKDLLYKYCKFINICEGFVWQHSRPHL